MCRPVPSATSRMASRLPIAPSLHGDTVVLSRDPTTIVRIVLQGAQSYHGPTERTNFSMPAFAALSDRQIAGVAEQCCACRVR